MTSIEINIKKLDISKSSAPIAANTAKSSVGTVPMVKHLTNEALCEKLGITYDRLVELMTKNPDFKTMTPEQQLAVMKEIPQTNANEQSEDQKIISVAENASQETRKEKPSVASKRLARMNAAAEFNKTEYKNLGAVEKANVYITELAKNKFMFAGETDKNELHWNALSKDERNKLVADYKKEFISKNSANAELFDKKSQKAFLDKAMTTLQAANVAGRTIEEFDNLKAGEKQDAIYAYLTDAKKYNSRSLSKSDEEHLAENDLLINSVKYLAKVKNNQDVDFCPSDAIRYLKDNKISYIDAQYNYLKAQNTYNKGELKEDSNKFEKERLASLSEFFEHDMSPEAKSKIGTRAGEQPMFVSDIQNSKYAKAFENASGSAEQAMILESYVKDTYKKDSQSAEVLSKYLSDALECGSLELAFAVHKIGKHDDNVALNNSRSKSEPIVVLNGMMAENLGVHAGTYVAELQKSEDKKLAKELTLLSQKTCVDEQMLDIAKVTAKIQDKDIQAGTVTNLRNRAKKSDVQLAVNKEIRENSSIETRKLAVVTTGKLNEDVQITALNVQLEDKNPELAEAAADVPSTLAVKNQTQAFKLVKTVSEGLSPEIAQRIGLKLADQIELSDKSNQLDMHKEIMTSKYQEVQERASGNIHKYDESVQSNALKVTYASGNEKAIQAAESHIQEYAPKVQTEIMNAKVIEAAYKEAQANDEAKISLSGSLSIAEIAKLSPAEKQEYYKQAFSKASPAEKIAMLTKLPGTQQKSVYTIICRFCPELLVGMVEGGQAKKMLNSGLPVDAVNKIFNIMERSTKIEVINQLKELKGDNAFKAYFTKDSAIEKAVTQKSPSSQGFNFFTNAFATPPRIASTEVKIYEKQQKKSMDIRI